MKGIAILLLATAAAVLPPAPEIRYFQYERSVQLPQGKAGQSCVALDAETLAHAAPGLADLRLYHDTTEVPYLLRDVRPHSENEQDVGPVNAGKRNGKTVFDAEMPQWQYNDLELDVAGHDFLATVTVFGGQSPDRVDTRIGSYTIFDFTAQKLGRSTVLHLPPSSFPRLHFEVDSVILPGEVRNVRVLRQAESAQAYIAVAAAGQARQQGRETVFDFFVPGNVPVDRVVFSPAAQPLNFSRDVEVAVAPVPPNTDDPSQGEAPSSWTGDILRIHRVEGGRKIDEERLAVDSAVVTYSRNTKWTVKVENGDDAPIAFSAVRLEMRERDFCFEIAPGAQYTLRYGDAALTAPKYDYAAWSVPQADSADAILGAEKKNAAYTPRPDARPFTERHPALLWIALVAAVAALGAIAFGSAKRTPKPTAMP